jgi:hypothetical protein
MALAVAVAVAVWVVGVLVVVAGLVNVVLLVDPLGLMVSATVVGVSGRVAQYFLSVIGRIPGLEADLSQDNLVDVTVGLTGTGRRYGGRGSL